MLVFWKCLQVILEALWCGAELMKASVAWGSSRLKEMFVNLGMN